MIRGWIGVLIVSVVVAGCITPASETSVTTSSSSSAAPTTTTGAANTTTPSEAPNTAPTGTITTANNTTGPAPLNVTFDLKGTDADGDNLSWTLVFGDDSENATGTELPANITHSFVSEGNYTVVFNISDGTDAFNVTLAVNVTAAVAADAEPYVISGSTLIPFPGGDLVACINDDIDGNIYDLAPAGPGWSYVLSPSDGSFGIYWYKGGSYASAGEPEGVVPDGMDQVEICNLSAAPGSDYTLTLTPP